ncbi:MAG: amidohydrolase [Halioglobus sp.]
MKSHTLTTLACLIALTLLSGCGRSNEDVITVFTAQSIITMDPNAPAAEVIAIKGDTIVAVGDLATVQETLHRQETHLDNRFDGKVIMPGFIDPHIHPSIAATILPMEIVAAMAWPTADGFSKPLRSPESFIERLRQLDHTLPPGDWLMAWGYHQPYHGPLNKKLLDQVSNERPIMIWQRSVHEMFFNSKALETLGLTEKDFAEEAHSNWNDGHIWESGLFALGQPMMKIIASPSRYLTGLSAMSDLIHRGGVTTVGEQGFPQISTLLEYWSLKWELIGRPYRFALVPNAMFFSNKTDSISAVLEAAEGLLKKSNDRIRVVKHIKYYADGAIYSQLMQMTEPYLDGHHGEWMIPPNEQLALLKAFWRAGWDIHIHVNGDAGLDKVLDDIALLRETQPGQKPKIVLEHYGYARDDQHERVMALGIAVSNNPYYLYELAPIYAEHGLGPSRAENISPLGGLHSAGVDISFHSDFTMAPLQPLTLAWVAVNRIASDDKAWGKHQRIPVEAALSAITIEAAKSLGLDHEIGSLEPGKKADFTILEENPYQVSSEKIKDIAIWGTVFEGSIHRLAGKSVH